MPEDVCQAAATVIRCQLLESRMARFERLDISLEEWQRILEGFDDRIVFQSSAWLRFLAKSQSAEIVFAALKEKEATLGYLCGLIVRRFGIRIFGSPFRGWSTPYMGLLLGASVSRRTAMEALPDFAFRQLGCMHFEVVDSQAKPSDVEGLHISDSLNRTIEVDLTSTEEAIFSKMTASCRRNVRKAEKNGLVIEPASDENFAAEYAEQLKDVFAKQGLVPHFGEDRVRLLIQELFPTGQLLLLRARDSTGKCIATGIYPALHNKAYYWGGASWREYQKLYPNELLHWHAMRYWKSKGAKTYNLVGTMEFKQRFGGTETAVPVVSKSKNRFVSFLRVRAPVLMKSMMRMAWKLRGGRKASIPQNAGSEEP